jgi:predicted amidohydrolase
MPNLKAAVAQVNPSTFDMNACVSKVCDYAEVAARKGVQLVVFGETCVGGNPGGDRRL